MKQLHLILISLVSLVLVRPRGFCTGNAGGPAVAVPPDIQKQLDAQEAQIVELQKALGGKGAAVTTPEVSSTLALLCKGAEVDVAEVGWRVGAGLDPEQAVQAALAQRRANARKTDAGKGAGKGK